MYWSKGTVYRSVNFVMSSRMVFHFYDTGGFTPTNTAFLQNLAIFDILHVLPGIRALAVKYFPNVEFERLAIEGDYSVATTHIPSFRVRLDPDKRVLPQQTEAESKEKRKGEAPAEGSERVSPDRPMFVIIKYRTGEVMRVQEHFGAIIPSSLADKRSCLKTEYANTVPAVKRTGAYELRMVGNVTVNGPFLETVAWDEVGEVWARAELLARKEGGSVLDIRVLEKVIMEMDDEMGLKWRE